MIHKTIQEIKQMVNGEYTGSDDRMICGVTIDSRTVEENMLYIPLIGARADGHSFIDSVIEKKAAAVLWQKDHKDIPEGIPCILVEDTQKALQQLAKAYLETLNCKIIGITGSNGKTSCKDMMYSVFSKEKKTQKTQGNRNNEIGLPLTILDFDEDIEVAVLEMGMENWGEIEFLTSIARPDIAVITTIGSAHKENLGGKLQIAQAKLEILQNMNPKGLFLYHKDSPEIEEAMKGMNYSKDIEIQSFGRQADVMVTSDIEFTGNSMRFSCNLLDEPVELNALGEVMAYNALPVIAAAKHEGIFNQSILTGLKELEMTRMRTQLISIKSAKILDDSYKSNPESAMAAIDTLMSIPAAKHIAVLADMLDLGEDENELHAGIGRYAEAKHVDLLYCTGPLSKHTANSADMDAVWFASKDSIVNDLKSYLDQDVVILIKGSRAMAMDTIVRDLQEED